MVALNGGGAFIIAFIIICFVVAIPVLSAEMILGRSTRHSPIGAFRDFIGKKFAWMGTWLVVICMLITAYYMAVVAWVVQYVGRSVMGSYFGMDSEQLGTLFTSVANRNPVTLLLFVLALVAVGITLYKGVGSIEKINLVMMPLLLGLCVIIVIRGLTLPGSIEGLKFIFSVDPARFGNSQTWLNAITQCAWSTGPGFGVTLALGAYSKAKSDITVNCALQAYGDQTVSLLGSLMVLPVLFALAPTVEAATDMCASGNTGLMFISLTGIFQSMPGGQIVAVLFFIALIFAAFTSSIAMSTVGMTALVDAGFTRKKAAFGTTLFMIIIGAPSAFSLTVFNNQDWTWGVLLLFGVVFIGFAYIKYGVEKARKEYLLFPENDWKIGPWWNVCVAYVSPAVIIIMIVWWVIQSIGWYPGDWWNPFLEASLGTIILQGGIVIAVCLIFNKKIAAGVKHTYFKEGTFPEIPEEMV
jgi:NSS family neurotransmitter:Na+ symporter